MMRRTRNLILACLVSLFAMSINAQEKLQYDWTKVMNAIIQVESKGNPKAYNPNGDCAGILQITKILINECNQILKNQKSSKRYTYEDRYNPEKSKEMFVIIQEYHNKEHNIEKAIKCWNCGFYSKNNGWKQKSIGYYKKVMKYYNNGGQ